MGETSIDGLLSSLQSQCTISSSSQKIDLLLNAQASTFLIASTTDFPFPSSILEMVSLRPLTYTSLKDILPPSPAGISATQSWKEIPIKNRLVKQAAWAYLQPMSSPRQPDCRSFLQMLRIRCSGECGGNCFDGCGCLEFINEHVVPRIRRAFGRVFLSTPDGENLEPPESSLRSV